MPNDEPERSWDDRLLPLITDEWVSVESVAARLHAPAFTVLARLKGMMRRNLVERRIVNHPTKMHAGRPLAQAQFRRMQLGRSVPASGSGTTAPDRGTNEA